ncbi:TRAP transporter small permease [Pseudolabrys taiwanensis]|uniref:TRAP transporter small permease n=1 Tax=Pseudolabrys taiwanensis TaxID=331696 RepID=UPI0013B35F06|nr:TRAP transporter small permease subunit [Pseudolabrys taiwanensis]
MLNALCLYFALAGGVVLVGMILMDVASIVGRVLVARTVPGDFELIEIGTAVTALLFLPYCQIKRQNVAVDLLVKDHHTRLMPLCSAIGNVLLGAFAAVAAWRSVDGGLDLWHGGDITSTLKLPLWPVFSVVVLVFVLLAIVCAYNAVCDIAALRRRDPVSI